MADWPLLDELKQVLDMESTDWDGDETEDLTRLAGVLSAAIARVKGDVGDWDEYVDVPDDALSRAALRMAVLLATSPENEARLLSISGKPFSDPTYERLMKGHRRAASFGVA